MVVAAKLGIAHSPAEKFCLYALVSEQASILTLA